MKSVRKPARRSLDEALKIVEVGIEKIVAEIRNPNDESKPSRPRGSRSKSPSRRAA